MHFELQNLSKRRWIHLLYFSIICIKKSDFKESFHAVGKILLNRRNYCLIKIAQDDRQRKDLKVSEEWKIEKKILSWLIKNITYSKKFPLIIRRGFMGKNFVKFENKPLLQGEGCCSISIAPPPLGGGYTF